MPVGEAFSMETQVADGAGGWRPAAVRCTFLDANHCPGAVMVSSLNYDRFGSFETYHCVKIR